MLRDSSYIAHGEPLHTDEAMIFGGTKLLWHSMLRTFDDMADKRFKLKKAVKAKTAKKAVVIRRPVIAGKSGPRLAGEQKDLLLLLLTAGELESSINSFFAHLGWGKLSSSTISHYRKLWGKEIEAARIRRVDDALTTGLALQVERVIALKDHALQLWSLRWTADDNGRFWNERAWRQTLDDLAAEMGERRPRDKNAGAETVKIYLGVDPDKV